MEATWLSVRFQANYSLLHVETYKTLHLSLILMDLLLEPTILEPTINEQPGEFSCSRPLTNTTWVMVGKPPHIVGEIRK